MQRQQIAVAGDDHVGSAVQGYFQEFVVFGIAAFADQLNYWDDLGDAFELR